VKKIYLALILIFLAGALVRGVDVLRPIDKASWRECDLAGIARNYVHENGNFFYPQVDWRGNTSGYAEMEFPLYPWLIAQTYKLVGVHDFIGRIWAFVFSLITIFYFICLARDRLSPEGAVFAALFFTFNPLFVNISTAIQPEGLMFMFYIAAVFYFSRWLETDKTSNLVFALITTALTILGKVTAAHIGLLFTFLAWQKFGWQMVKNYKLWIFGVWSLLPAALWYAHAKLLWLNYGNSLGVSNETHSVGWRVFTETHFVFGILRLEIVAIWLFAGLLIGIWATFAGRKEPIIRFCLVWLISVFLLYLAAANTTAEDWAAYYHIFSLAPVSLLIGFGMAKCLEMWRKRENALQLLTAVFLSLAFLVTLFVQARHIRADILDKHVVDESYICVDRFKQAMKKDGLILVSGGNCVDENNLPVAYNASYMFYWLGRKGFNLCVQDQSLEKVQSFARQGAKYFLAEKNKLQKNQAFEVELKKAFPQIAECDSTILFDISPNN
jgi:4-amino-4-deoxy-L-arabinose transferase-like glycosyltransferase